MNRPLSATTSLPRIWTFLAVFTALILSHAAKAQADDWPQWRGPNRDAVWKETGILQTFPPDGLKIS
jgi:hypothetical protein